MVGWLVVGWLVAGFDGLLVFGFDGLLVVDLCQKGFLNHGEGT